MRNITYEYQRANAPGNYPAIDPRLSRHHIISYPFMRTFAEVLLQFRNDPEVDVAKREQIRALIDDFKRNNHIAGANDAALIVYLCWARPNLFIGPSSAYRDDDPSQRMEELPLLLNSRVRESAKKVKELWNGVSSSYLVGEKDTRISISVDERKVPDFLIAFLNYVNLPNDIYDTKCSEWLVVCETDPKNLRYRFYIHLLSERRIQEELHNKLRYKFVLKQDQDKVVQKSVVVIHQLGDKKCLGETRKALPDSEDKSFAECLK